MPLVGRADLAAELAPLFASSALEKATFDLRGQLGGLVRAWGLGALGMGGGAPPRAHPGGAPALADAATPARAGVGGDMAATAAAAPPLVLCEPLVDVRIAGWLSTPDDKQLRDEQQVGGGGCYP